MKKLKLSQRYKRMLRELKKARLDAGLTQAEVAKKFGAHASFVSKCESGERRVDVIELVDFCRLYKISIGELLKRSGIG